MDSYEEERKAKFDSSINVLVKALDLVRQQLVALKETDDEAQRAQIFDESMDLLYVTMRLSRPLAIVESHGDRVAFRWHVVRDQTPTYFWIVCGDNGTYQFGSAGSQEECEKAARDVLFAG